MHKFHLISWLMGFIDELSGKPMPFGPLAKCSYNGVPLPGLPLLDWAALPYVLISGGTDGFMGLHVFRLFVFSSPPVLHINPETGKYWGYDGGEISYIRYVNAPDYKTPVSKWTKDADMETPAAGVIPIGAPLEDALLYNGVTWANFDCYDDAGNLVIAGSKPEPVRTPID